MQHVSSDLAVSASLVGGNVIPAYRFFCFRQNKTSRNYVLNVNHKTSTMAIMKVIEVLSESKTSWEGERKGDCLSRQPKDHF